MALFACYIVSPIHKRPMCLFTENNYDGRRQVTALIHMACGELFIQKPFVPYTAATSTVLRERAGSGWRWKEHLSQAQVFEPRLDAGIGRLPADLEKSIRAGGGFEPLARPKRVPQWQSVRSKDLIDWINQHRNDTTKGAKD